MSTDFEEALMGLDLDSNSSESSIKNVAYSIEDRQKRQLYMLKKRIVAVNVLVNKCRDKSFLLSTTENMLSSLKTEYKLARVESQVTCKNYKSVQEKCATLEGEISMLKSKCNQLELEALRNDSNKAAAQSYTKQLQQLVKERDSTIEALKLENNLVKDSTVGFQKKITKLNKIIIALKKNLGNVADVVFTKRILNKREKITLCKYMRMNRFLKEKKKKERICDLMEGEPNSDNESVVFGNIILEPEETVGNGMMIMSATADEIEKGNDSDNAVSEDTGRGSSLACSNTGFLSPTYSIESPSSVKSVINNNKNADSPLQSLKTVEETEAIATSPITFERTKHERLATPVASPKVLINQPTSLLKFDFHSKTDVPDIVVIIDDAVNEVDPLPLIDKTENNDDIEPLLPVAEKRDSGKNSHLCDEESNDEESLLSIGEAVNIDGIEPLSPVAEKRDSDKYSHLCDENSNDGEIEMILQNMRVSRDLLTPIPATPARSISRSTVMSRVNRDSQNEMAKMREDIAELENTVKSIMPFANLLQNVIMDDKITKLLQDCIKRNIKEVLQDTITNVEKVDISKSDDERILEKSNQTQEKACGKDLDDCASLDEDPTIHNHFYSTEKESEQEKSFVMPNLKPSQQLMFKDKLTDDEEVDEIDLIDTTVNTEPAPNKQDKKMTKVKKLTKLEKLRQNLLPKTIHNHFYSTEKESEQEKSFVMPNLKPSQQLMFKDKLTDDEEVDEIDLIDTTENTEPAPNKQDKKMTKVKKLTKPEKLRQNLLPKTIHNHFYSTEKESEQEKSFVMPNLKPSQKLMFKDKLTDDEEVDEIDAIDTTENVEQSPNKQDKKMTKYKKLTKLEKLRKNLLPKSKIRRDDLAQPRKLRSKVIVPNTKQKNESPAASLNNKEAYEKAVKIMAELKSKQKDTKITKGKKDDSENCNNKDVNGNCSPNSNKVKTNEKCCVPIGDGHDKKREKSISPLKKIEASIRNNSGELAQPQIGNIVTRSRLVTRSRQLSTESNDSITLAELATPRRDEMRNRVKSVEGENVYKSSPRRKTSNSDSQECRSLIEEPDLVRNLRRRKSLTPEFDSVKISNRSKYPSCSFDKDVVVVIDQADIREKIVELDNTTLSKCKETKETIIREKTVELDNTTLNKCKETKETMHRNGSRRASEDMALEKRKPLLRKRPSTDNPESDESDAKVMRKRLSDDKAQSSLPKRVLRSSILSSSNDKVVKETENIIKSKQNDVDLTTISPHPKETNNLPSIISYTDLDIFSDEPAPNKQLLQDDPPVTNETTDMSKPHENILCRIIEKHGINKLKVQPPKIPEAVVNSVHEKIEKGISLINELPLNNNKQEMNNLVDVLKKLKHKDFLAGLMKYLADPQRKIELYNKITAPPAPPMTKSEQVLLYLVMKLKGAWPNVDIVNEVLKYIEYNLFKLNGSPDFTVIESMSHFYAILCRYINSKSRLKLFMLDSMYCINFKAIPLIKQCLEVWMHILPLAHMGTAKSPLVTCIVYLLHYYKTKEDRFNRVQEIRNILSHRYFFKVTEWNETRILEMFKNAILELRDSHVEKKMLRLALIILAKRQGPRWCQTKIITNLLQPLINQADVSETAKAFCVSLLGPLVKPYPMDMKVHCEITLNQLLDLLKNNPSPSLAEAVFISLISINRHNQNRVIQAMLEWNPDKVAPDLENLLKDFVREKPVKNWKKLLRQIYLERQD